MRSVWQATIFLFVIVLFSLIYKLPAKFVYQYVENSSQIQLLGVSGSIWFGHVDQVQTKIITLDNVNWTLSPSSLLFGKVSINWSIKDIAVELAGELEISSTKTAIKNTHGLIDLIALAEKLPTQEFLLGGDLKLDIDSIQIADEKITDAAGNVTWQHAELLSPENIVLGDFSADLTSKADRLVVQATDLGGPVSFKGEMELLLQGTFQYDVKIGVRDVTATGLIEGFNQLGQADEEGNVTFRANGNLF